MIIVPVKDGENIERALKKVQEKIRKNWRSKGTPRSPTIRQTLCAEALEDGACRVCAEAPHHGG